MANQTTNIGLRKPVPTENFDIDRDFNANWDIIDGEFGDLEAGVANTYTKAEVDTKDSMKADKADTYTKAEVDGKDALKADLSEIEVARGTEPTLGARLDADKADYEALTQDYTQHKLDYTSQRQQDQLKVAKVEKDINDYQSIMVNMNPNQEVIQKATGYGVVSLPKNTANGQFSATVNGNSLFQEADNGEDNNNWIAQNANATINADGITIMRDSELGGDARLIIDLMPDTEYTAIFRVLIPTESANLRMLNASSVVASSVDIDCSTIGVKRATFTTTTKIDVSNPILRLVLTSVGELKFTDFMIFQGDQTDNDAITHYISYGTKSTVSASRLKSVGKNLFDKSKVSPINTSLNLSTGLTGFSIGQYTSDYISVKPSTNYRRTVVGDNRYKYCYYDKNKSFISGESKVGIITTPSNCMYIRFAWNTVSPNNVQLVEGTFETPYEPYTESTQYLPNIGELRSLPNGTKDEIRVSGGKAEHIERTKKHVLQASDIYGIILNGTNAVIVSTRVFTDLLYADSDSKNLYIPPFKSGLIDSITLNSVANVNCVYMSGGSNDIKFIFTSGTTLEQARQQLTGLELTYQLAEPIITPINVSGTLLSNPSGTVYVENVIADAGTYTTKFDIKELQLPIKSIDKLIKYDFATGVQTVLDTSLAVINADKKSFTHPNLVKGDMVFVDYFYDVEGTLGEATVEYLDSRHTIKDSVNNKFYKWDIKSANGVPTVELTEVL